MQLQDKSEAWVGFILNITSTSYPCFSKTCNQKSKGTETLHEAPFWATLSKASCCSCWTYIDSAASSACLLQPTSCTSSARSSLSRLAFSPSVPGPGCRTGASWYADVPCCKTCCSCLMSKRASIRRSTPSCAASAPNAAAPRLGVNPWLVGSWLSPRWPPEGGATAPDTSTSAPMACLTKAELVAGRAAPLPMIATLRPTLGAVTHMALATPWPCLFSTVLPSLSMVKLAPDSTSRASARSTSRDPNRSASCTM
mmetsp:Transcript_20365/g.56741  ORF Transcript_20365/g.56741 Transcript_20365/m.56741 type:complete len:255 (+) Transcript_20365:171-935(+)